MLTYFLVALTVFVATTELFGVDEDELFLSKFGVDTLRGLGSFVGPNELQSLQELNFVCADVVWIDSTTSVDIGAMLRAAGFQTCTREEQTPQHAYLGPRVTGNYLPPRRFWTSHLRLLQPVALSRDSTIRVRAVTWQDSKVKLNPTVDDKKQILTSQVESFISDVVTATNY